MSLVNTNWKTRSKKVLVKNKYVEFWEDEVERPDGEISTYYVLRKKPFSIIVPLEKDHVYLVNQYRYSVSSLSLEFPAGNTPDIDPKDVPKAELVQEAGITADMVHEIGKFWIAVGKTNQVGYVYVAEGLHFGKTNLDDGEFIEVKKHSLNEVK